ncbi:MAG: biotin transporter BioY [Cyanobacteria bacterium P01_D01_bin.105]
MLTILSTWLEAYGVGIPQEAGEAFYSLGVNYQVGAVLFTGCMGGKNAAALSQIAYLMLGLVLFERFGLPVFTEGAGLGYVRSPAFGYLLGFVPAGWLCGYLAFRGKATLERLAFSALCGLIVVHVCGVFYLVMGHLFRALSDPPLFTAIIKYSLAEVPGQVMVACAIALIAYGMRRALFY